jgi:hypothetical protein
MRIVPIWGVGLLLGLVPAFFFPIPSQADPPLTSPSVARNILGRCCIGWCTPNADGHLQCPLLYNPRPPTNTLPSSGPGSPAGYYVPSNANPGGGNVAINLNGFAFPHPSPGDDQLFMGWYSINGSKIFMTWKSGDMAYFTGWKLWQDVGIGVYHLDQAPYNVSDPNQAIDPDNADRGTYLQYYTIPYDHDQPNKPATQDSDITSKSLTAVLGRFPWVNPHVLALGKPVTQATYDALLAVYRKFIYDHTRQKYSSLLLPITSVDVSSICSKPAPAYVFQCPYTAVLGGGTPVTGAFQQPVVNLSTFNDSNQIRYTQPDSSNPATGYFQFPSFDPNGYWSFKMKLVFHFQQVPNLVNIPGVSPAGEHFVALRNPSDWGSTFYNGNGSPDYDYFMGLLYNPTTATSSAGNADNNLNGNMFIATNNNSIPDFLNPAVSTSALNSTLPSQFTTMCPAAYSNNPSKFYSRVATPGDQLQWLTMQDFKNMGTSGNLTAEYGPSPHVSFDCVHMAEQSDTKLQQQMGGSLWCYLMRQCAQQGYVQSVGEIRRTTNTAAADWSTEPVALSWNVVGDFYQFSENYVPLLFPNLAALNAYIASNTAAGGGYTDGDPYARTKISSRAIKVAPASQDTANANKLGVTDDLVNYFPDPRSGTDLQHMASILGAIYTPFQPGNTSTFANAFIEAQVMRGASFNFVWDRGGAKIDPTKGAWPPAYWANPQHAALILPYQPYVPGSAARPVIGPYLINLDSVRSATLKPGNTAFYTWAKPPFHYNQCSYPANKYTAEPTSTGGCKPDMCMPIVFPANSTLLSALNDLYDFDGDVDVHMTAACSAIWHTDNHGYWWSANLFLQDFINSPTDLPNNTGILRVPVKFDHGHPPIPPPWGFIPLTPEFQTYAGTGSGGLNLVHPPPAGANNKYVASYEARVFSSAGYSRYPRAASAETVGVSILSVDQTAKVVAVDGCGMNRQVTSQTICSLSQGPPSASITITPDGGDPFTVGLPIHRRNFIFGNTSSGFGILDSPQYATPSATSLTSRVDASNRQNLLVSRQSPTIDGTMAQGTPENPGNTFFRTTTTSLTVGRSAHIQIIPESFAAPGVDLYDMENNIPGRPATLLANPYAGYIKQVDLSIFPPATGGGHAGEADLSMNLYRFQPYTQSSIDYSASAPPPPPICQADYVFQRATTPPPAAGTDVSGTDSYYLLRVVVSDVNGSQRTINCPIWVLGQSQNFNAINHTESRK